MLKQLARFKVHFVFAAFIFAWFALSTITGVAEGQSVLQAFWSSLKEVKPMEWISMSCLWVALTIFVNERDKLLKQNEELRARLNAQAGGH